jgi:hypothetical protein
VYLFITPQKSFIALGRDMSAGHAPIKEDKVELK